MDTDPTTNTVAFRLGAAGPVSVGRGRTRDDDSVRQAWDDARREHVLDPDVFGGGFVEATETLSRGLTLSMSVDESKPRKGRLLTVSRTAGFASSALALPDFAARLAVLFDSDRLTVGIPDPDTLLAADATSAWTKDIRAAVRASSARTSQLSPTMLELRGTEIKIK